MMKRGGRNRDRCRQKVRRASGKWRVLFAGGAAHEIRVSAHVPCGLPLVWILSTQYSVLSTQLYSAALSCTQHHSELSELHSHPRATGTDTPSTRASPSTAWNTASGTAATAARFRRAVRV